MSTKLYDGYKLPKMTLSVFFKKLEVLKKEMNKLVQKDYEESVIHECLEIYDHICFYPESNVIYPRLKNKANIIRIINDKIDYTNSLFRKISHLQHFYAHIQFYEYNGYMYAIPRARGKIAPIEKLLKKIMGAKPYGYWNNTDRPRGISAQQWKAREKEWDKVFGNSDWDTSNARNNLKLEVFADIFKYNSHHSFKFKHNLKKYLTDPKRGLKIAESLALAEYPEIDSNKIWSILSSDEYRSKIKKNLSLVQSKLEQDINIEDIASKEVSVIQKPNSEKNFYVYVEEE